MRFFPFYKSDGTAIAFITVNGVMKNILITASALGAAIAGLILYYQKKNTARTNTIDIAKDAYQRVGNGFNNVKRPAHHAMG